MRILDIRGGRFFQVTAMAIECFAADPNELPRHRRYEACCVRAFPVAMQAPNPGPEQKLGFCSRMFALRGIS
jgi:hypothetical protein